MIRARKRFGQHFLEPAWADKVIRAIDPNPDETFLEIGPGTGAITRPLVARAKAVVAFEIDRDLAAALRAVAPPTLLVVTGDFLENDWFHGLEPQQVPRALRVAGNLPYNVASPILFKLIALHDTCRENGVALQDATVMLQREVADRLVAKPGTKEYGVLSVLVQHRASVEIVLKLPPGAFRPLPKVQSALVRLRFHPPKPPVRDEKVFERLVKAVFSHRRKTLANALRSRQFRGQPPGQLPDWSAPGIPLDLTRRPETLSVHEFAALADVFSMP